MLWAHLGRWLKTGTYIWERWHCDFPVSFPIFTFRRDNILSKKCEWTIYVSRFWPVMMRRHYFLWFKMYFYYLSQCAESSEKKSLYLNQCCIHHEHCCHYGWPHWYYTNNVPSRLLESFLIQHDQNVLSMNCIKQNPHIHISGQTQNCLPIWNPWFAVLCCLGWTLDWWIHSNLCDSLAQEVSVHTL